MIRKKIWRKLVVWTLVLGMVLSDGSLAVYAQETEQQSSDISKENKAENEEESKEKNEEEIQSVDENSIQSIGETKAQPEKQDDKESEDLAEPNAAKPIAEIVDRPIAVNGVDEGDSVDLSFNCESEAGEQIRWDAENASLQVFENQSVTVTVQKSGEKVNDIKWEVYDTNNNLKEGVLQTNGDKLSFSSQPTEDGVNSYRLYASSGAERAFIYVSVYKISYDYQCPYELSKEGRSQVLRSDNIWLGETVGYNCSSPKYMDGRFDETTVSSVEVSNDCVESRKEGEGWYLTWNKTGKVTVKMTVNRAADDPEKDPIWSYVKI